MPIDYAVNIAAVRKSALYCDVVKGTVWYPNARETALDMSPHSVTAGAGVLAAFSPRQPWPITVRNARRAFSHGTAAGHKPALHTQNMVRAADRLIRGWSIEDALKGDKTRAFARAIACGGTDGIAVIDRHAHDIAMGHFDFTDDTRNIGKRLYRDMAAAYAEVADYFGEPVHATQAITWESWRRGKGTWDVWRNAPVLVGNPDSGTMTVYVAA